MAGQQYRSCREIEVAIVLVGVIFRRVGQFHAEHGFRVKLQDALRVIAAADAAVTGYGVDEGMIALPHLGGETSAALPDSAKDAVGRRAQRGDLFEIRRRIGHYPAVRIPAWFAVEMRSERKIEEAV